MNNITPSFIYKKKKKKLVTIKAVKAEESIEHVMYFAEEHLTLGIIREGPILRFNFFSSAVVVVMTMMNAFQCFKRFQ